MNEEIMAKANELIESGDPTKIAEAQQMLDNLQNGIDNPETPAQEPDQGANQQPGQQAAQTQPPQTNEQPEQQSNPMYSFVYKGQEKTLNNNDGYLGYKSEDGIKKALAHRTAYSQELQTQNFELQNQLIALQEKANQANYQQPPIAQQHQYQQQPQPIEQQEEISLTDLPEDPVDWDAKHGKAVINTTQKLLNEIQELKQKVSKYDQMSEEQLQQQAYQSTMSEYETFRNKYPQYKTTDKPIAQIDPEVRDWSNRLAGAFSIFPQGTTEEHQKIYEQARDNLVSRYRQNDPTIVAQANQICPPPEGAIDYFNIVQLNERKNELGGKISFDDILTLEVAKSGQLNNFIDQAKQETGNNVAKAMINQTQQYATNLQNSVPEVPFDVVNILSQDRSTLNEDDKAKYDKAYKEAYEQHF